MPYVDELFSLRGKVAVVVGGSGLLGGRIACALARVGAKVAVVFNRNREAADNRVKEIEGHGGEAMKAQANVLNKLEIQKVRDQICSRWDKVHILVNAPGVNSTTPVLEITEEEWHAILNTNLKGIFLCCQVFGELMIKQKERGSIINVSSVSSEVPLSKVFTYSISKSGVNSLTRSLARDWASSKIRVNAIIPGFFPAEQNRTILTDERKKSILDHTPMGRYGEPEELAGVVVWLASERASSFVTAAIIPVDGGFTGMTI
ncbi:MAG: SDR family oxidoreductase [Ignavibacteria bacterium]|nr:SDR family oxidoreductase [Ignavibacteria bacterium]